MNRVVRRALIIISICGVCLGSAFAFFPKPFKMIAFGLWVLFEEPKSRNYSEAKKRWGNAPFKPQQFRLGDESLRSSMAADAVQNQIFVGKSEDELNAALGGEDGGYYDDGCRSYRLVGGISKGEEQWDLVFCLLYPEQKVRTVLIYRSCCDRIPKWMID